MANAFFTRCRSRPDSSLMTPSLAEPDKSHPRLRLPRAKTIIAVPFYRPKRALNGSLAISGVEPQPWLPDAECLRPPTNAQS